MLDRLTRYGKQHNLKTIGVNKARKQMKGEGLYSRYSLFLTSLRPFLRSLEDGLSYVTIYTAGSQTAGESHYKHHRTLIALFVRQLLGNMHTYKYISRLLSRSEQYTLTRRDQKQVVHHLMKIRASSDGCR